MDGTKIKLIGKLPELNNPIFVEGLPGVGNVGRIAVGMVAWFALVFAANLGGNITTIGSPTNVIAFGIAKQEGVDITFFDYMKKTGLLSIILLTVAFVYLMAISPLLA